MKYKKPFFISLTLFPVLALIMFLPLIVSFGKTGKNTKLLNRDYSLLSKADIESRLESDFPLPKSIILNTPEREITLEISTFTAKINTSKMASTMLFRRLNQGIANYIKAFFQPRNFSLDVSYDNAKLVAILTEIAAQIDQPFVPSELVLTENNTVQLKTGQLGRKTDVAYLRELVISSLEGYSLNQPLNVPLEAIGSLPDSATVEKNLQRAKNLISKKLTLISPHQNVDIDPATLISWLDFSGSCQEAKIGQYVENLKVSIQKDPVDAILKVEDNRVVEFTPSQDGYTLSDRDLASKICPAIVSLETGSELISKLDIPLIPAKPKIQTADVNNLGIETLLGRGVSTFKHSSAIRNFNVEKGASIINRILVAPGETFSFVDSLGEVTLETGFKKAYVIRKGKTELDVGGGVCQVSTTLFRAILNSGFEVTERKAHAYRVSYYEEDSKPGFDATVFIPSPDLKFINDSSKHVLIQSQYDGKEKRLTYEIYGTSDGRQAEISNYRQWDAQPAPPDIYIDDPTLPVGKVVQDEHRIPGLKTSFDWKVTRNGEIIHQKTFQSSYVPWAAVYRRGVNP